MKKILCALIGLGMLLSNCGRRPTEPKGIYNGSIGGKTVILYDYLREPCSVEKRLYIGDTNRCGVIHISLDGLNRFKTYEVISNRLKLNADLSNLEEKDKEFHHYMKRIHEHKESEAK